MSLQVDELLQDRYLIVRSIKQGGMGAVYEARDTKLADSPCAVKEILESARLGHNSQYIEGRFFQEMKALSALDHPSIPKVRDYLTVDSTIYIVMELVQGPSLEEEIEQSMQRSSLPPEAEKSVRDILSLLETVAYLHGQDPVIIHRDIKPGNVLRDAKTGNIKLVDFGLARQLDTTSNHTLVGTLGYCAPEQMMGKASQESDLYSVAMTLHHLLTGRAPDMLNFEPLKPELPGLRAGLSQIIERATQLKPGDRYSSAHDMAKDLRAWLEGRPVSASALTPTLPTRSGTLWAKAAVAVLALGSALAAGRALAPGQQPGGVPSPMMATASPATQVQPRTPAKTAAQPVATRRPPAPAKAPEPKTVVKYVYVPQPAPAPRKTNPEVAPIVPSLGDTPAYPVRSGPVAQKTPRHNPPPQDFRPPQDWGDNPPLPMEEAPFPDAGQAQNPNNPQAKARLQRWRNNHRRSNPRVR
ncbi:protein kinase [bacterium]|nr:protein kinase [bacterium]